MLADVVEVDEDEDNISLVTLVGNTKLHVLADVSGGVVLPKGDMCVGLEVARDFVVEQGLCTGKITRVDANRRRPLYHVVYTDGDEED